MSHIGETMTQVGPPLAASTNLIVENLAYLCCISGNVKALGLATRRLMATETDVKIRVKKAALDGLRRTNRVGEWLRQVEAVIEEVDHIMQRDDQEKSRCLGRRSFNFWSNYWIGRDAATKLEEVQELWWNGHFEDVADVPLSRVQEFPIASEVLPKEEADLQKILRYIDDDQSDIIGIWGMGGVGKTRLLQLVHNRHAQNSAFDVVIFVTASRDCSVEKVQAELCEKYRFGRASDVHSQAKIISDYLSCHNFLLLLDDVWDHIDLQKIGIPFPLGRVDLHNRKVVITTRSFRVCNLMEVKRDHKVACLDNNDSLRLFYEMVGVETIKLDPLVRSHAEEVVKKLNGLPIALIAIGRAMRSKKDHREWANVIDLLHCSRLNEIETTRDECKIYNQLKFSYDSLETQELKDCFVACALWPEDFEIPKIQLIECWMGLGILHASGCRNIYNSGYTVIHKLLSACLLEQVGSEHVKMQSVFRDMALWLVCGCGTVMDKWIVRNGVGVDQALNEKNRWLHTERAVLLYPNEMINNPIPCEANNLHFLRIHGGFSNPEALNQNLKSFYALTFLDLSTCNISFFPPNISNLINLRYLNLSHNWISSVPEELKLATNLKYLFLRKNRIVSFPEGIISKLIKLEILDLYEFCGYVLGGKLQYLTWVIQELECLDNISSLGITLEHPDHFEALLKLPYLPIRSLLADYTNGIYSLIIPSHFIGNNRIQDNLYELHLRGHSVKKVEIESDPENLCCQLKNLEFLHISMSVLEEIIWRNVAPADLFPGLRVLEIQKCGKLSDVSWTLSLPCLQELSLSGGSSMVCVIKQSGSESATEGKQKMATHTFLKEGKENMATGIFPKLSKLVLYELPNLQYICDPSITFDSMESISIWGCPVLKQLPFRQETVPTKLTTIGGESTWWEQLDWDDKNLKKTLQVFFKEI